MFCPWWVCGKGVLRLGTSPSGGRAAQPGGVAAGAGET